MHVLLTTNHGNIKIALDAVAAPKTVANFLAYVNAGMYNNTLFHRVIDDFMIQGGAYEPTTFKEHPTWPPIENESNNGLINEAYTIAMARRSGTDSATCQFFINLVLNRHLDYTGTPGSGYCVFGKVVAGKDTLDRIRVVKTERRFAGFEDVPVEPVIIEKAEMVA